ncbi:MAG TPA: DUF1800 family protein [Pirellulales bacterium]|jgi:uncharacterized protein (DUF1800 family)
MNENESNSNRWRHDPAEAWLAWSPSEAEPWNLTRVLSLHRRAGFSATWAEAQRDLAEGHEAALSRILSGAATGPDGRKAVAIDAFCDAMFESYRANGNALDPIRQAWFYRLIFSAWPLRERVLLAWHTHYATSEAKVTQTQTLFGQHQTQRGLWQARQSKLHLAMLRDEAMLVWLDGVANQRGAPNENLAREFLELFALGVGNYTESDVKETARALTGWHRVYNLPTDVRFQASLHDAETKTILGKTGAWGEEDVARIACAHPAAARRIAWRLWRTFISDVDEPTSELLEALAVTMRVDEDIDVERGLKTIIRSRLFHSDAYVSRRVLSPVEWIVCVLRAGEAFPPHPDLGEIVAVANRMGQRLFRPPNVAGWPGGLEWLSGPALVARQNFAAWLTSDESTVTTDHWFKLAERHGVAGGEGEIGFWTALFWGRPAHPDEKKELSAQLIGSEPASRAGLVRALLTNPAVYLA